MPPVKINPIVQLALGNSLQRDVQHAPNQSQVGVELGSLALKGVIGIHNVFSVHYAKFPWLEKVSSKRRKLLFVQNVPKID